jgi:ABC-type branched-subunit amino acid transport system ATPase component
MLDALRKTDAPAPATGGSEPPPDDVIVQLRNIHKSFGENDVLKGISLSVPKGSSEVVLGGSARGRACSSATSSASSGRTRARCG